MPSPPPPEHTRWKPGQSGNPKGYSRGRRQIDDLIRLIEETDGAERAISKAWLKQILSGSLPHLKEYLDRRDGKIPTPVEVGTSENTGNDFITVTPADDQPSDEPAKKILE